MAGLPSNFSLLRLLSLRSGQADAETIDARIRDNARLGGTNLWVLMFAIVIASVGLNVNSTAVIIGAMLISPLMGPIIGIGFGAAIHDYALIRQSLRNLATFVLISLFASTLYFFLTPLKEAHSELLARTSPSFWDVLIAFFGGAAGAIGLTRREPTTLIPGVAIATALMPPLCTAGFGIATGQPAFFLGAFYLFLINGVFIALANLAIMRVLRLPPLAEPDAALRRRGRTVIALAVIATLVPSTWLAWDLVQEEIFKGRVARFVRQAVEERDDLTLIYHQADRGKREIRLTVIGRGATPELEAQLNERLRGAGLAGTALRLRRPSDAAQELGSLKRELQQEILHRSLAAQEEKSARLAEMDARLARLDATVAEFARIENEIRAQVPALAGVTVTGTTHKDAEGKSRLQVLVALDAPRGLPAAETQRLRRWLAARLPEAEIRLIAGKLL